MVHGLAKRASDSLGALQSLPLRGNIAHENVVNRFSGGFVGSARQAVAM